MNRGIIVVCLFVCLAGSSFAEDEGESSFEARSSRALSKLKKLVVKNGPPKQSPPFLGDVDFKTLNILTPAENDHDAVRAYFKNSVLLKRLGEQYAVIYLRNSDPMTVKLQNLKSFLNFETETVFLFSGAVHERSNKATEHANFFYNTMIKNLLKSGNYMVVALHVFHVDEKHYEDTFKNIVGAGILGTFMANTLNQARANIQSPKSLYIIGEDLGCVTISTMSLALYKKPDYIYCLAERFYNKNYLNELYVRQDHGKLVQKIHKGQFPYSYAARDIYPNNGAVTNTDIIKMLADDMLITGSVVSGMCINFKMWKDNKCTDLPQVSIWNTKFPTDFTGRYYLERSRS